MPGKPILLVESPNDQHVLYALLQRFSIPKEICDVQPKGGVTNVLQTLKILLKFEDEEQAERIGIIVDADLDIAARWGEVRNLLANAGYTNIPAIPETEGTVIQQEGMPIIGIWIMPNNTVPGELEDFVTFLVPQGDILWEKAVECVQQLPEHRFSPKHETKARIHTWLAWQKEPGTPMGWAITKKYLNSDVAEVHQLINWFRQLVIE